MRRSLICVAQRRLFLSSLLPNVPANLPGPARPFNAATAPLPLQTESLTSPLICRARKFILPASPPFPEKKKCLFLFLTVSQLNGRLRKQKFTLTGSKGHGL